MNIMTMQDYLAILLDILLGFVFFSPGSQIFILYSDNSGVCSLQCAVICVQFIMFSGQCAIFMFCVHFALCSEQCAVCNFLCLVCSMQFLIKV